MVDEGFERDKQILLKAITDLFSSYNSRYGLIRKFKSGGNLVIEAVTGGWSDNEEAIRKFNSTKFEPATIEWWFLEEWKKGGYFRWEIPLFFIEEVNKDGRGNQRGKK